MKYKEKLKIVEAVQVKKLKIKELGVFTEVGLLKDGKAELVVAGQEKMLAHHGVVLGPDDTAVFLPTDLGITVAKENDYVVKDNEGKLMVFSPEVFEELYEPV